MMPLELVESSPWFNGWLVGWKAVLKQLGSKMGTEQKSKVGVATEQTELKLKMEEKARKDEKMRKKRKELRQRKQKEKTVARFINININIARIANAVQCHN